MNKYSNWRFLLTPLCNARCFFCHRDGSGVETDKTFLSLDKFKTIIDEYGPQMEKIRFSGGDPFLNPQLFEMVKIALSVTPDVSVGTNGLLLDKYNDQIIDSKLKKITVSVHSMNPKSYSEIMKVKPENLEKVVRSISKLNGAVKFKINVVVLKDLNTSEKELEDLIDYALKNGLNMEFEELDLGSIYDLNFEKYHYPPNILVEVIQKLKNLNFIYDKTESIWGAKMNDSVIKVQMCHCYNKMCEKCVFCRPIIVYPNGDMNRCRMGTPYVNGISGEF